MAALVLEFCGWHKNGHLIMIYMEGLFNVSVLC